jgi:hypothetical protein
MSEISRHPLQQRQSFSSAEERGDDVEGQETAWIEVEEEVEEEVKRGREEGRGRGGCVKCGMRWEMTSFFLQLLYKSATNYPEVELKANLKSNAHRCHLFEVAFARQLT